MNRKVEEADFRAKKFKSAKVEDYEFRGDGELVRKDRFEMAVSRIAGIVGATKRGEYEIPDVMERVELLTKGIMDKKRVTILYYMVRHAAHEYEFDSFFVSAHEEGIQREHYQALKDNYDLEFMGEALTEAIDKMFAEEFA